MPNLVLASGPITNSDDLVVELVTPPDAPPAILIRWPGNATPSVCPPTRFPAAALAVIAVLDNALQEFSAQVRTTPLTRKGSNGCSYRFRLR